MTNEQLGVTLRGYADRLSTELERVDDELDGITDVGLERHIVRKESFNILHGISTFTEHYGDALLLDNLRAIIDEIEGGADILLDKG